MRKEVAQMPDGRTIVYYWFRENVLRQDANVQNSAAQKQNGPVTPTRVGGTQRHSHSNSIRSSHNKRIHVSDEPTPQDKGEEGESGARDT